MTGTTNHMDHVPLARALAEQLPASVPEDIRRLFAQVPRHHFLPDVMWADEHQRYDRTTDPAAWLRAAYTDQALVTQRDDGTEGGMGVPTSSSSAPSVMARMLTAARIEPTHHVLEIGTGTGYNAALLSQLLGPDQVTTVEIDPTLAQAAQTALHSAGFHPKTVTGDGEQPTEGAPSYDRVIATCTVSQIPAAWIRQLRPQGRIITPWAPSPGLPAGVLAVLEPSEPGRVQGHFEGPLSFMWARGQRKPTQPAPSPSSTPESTRQVPEDPRQKWLDAEAALLLSLLMPDWSFGFRMEPGATEPHVWIASTTCFSWARVHADGRIEQAGKRHLIDEATQAWHNWQTWGQPAASDFGLTVDLHQNTQTVFLQSRAHRKQ